MPFQTTKKSDHERELILLMLPWLREQLGDEHLTWLGAPEDPNYASPLGRLRAPLDGEIGSPTRNLVVEHTHVPVYAGETRNSRALRPLLDVVEEIRLRVPRGNAIEVTARAEEIALVNDRRLRALAPRLESTLSVYLEEVPLDPERSDTIQGYLLEEYEIRIDEVSFSICRSWWPDDQDCTLRLTVKADLQAQIEAGLRKKISKPADLESYSAYTARGWELLLLVERKDPFISNSGQWIRCLQRTLAFPDFDQFAFVVLADSSLTRKTEFHLIRRPRD